MRTLIYISLTIVLLTIEVHTQEISQQSFEPKCLLCKWTASLIIDYHAEGAKPRSLFKVLSTLCSFLGGQDKNVCTGMINNVGEQLFAILDVANGTVSAKDICGMVLGGSCAHESKRLYHWSLDIPDLDNEPQAPPPKWPRSSNRTHKILHLSDPHVQLDYAVGSSTDCDKFICCSSDDPPPKDASKVAGLFGDYHCDLPLRTLEVILSHAKETHPDLEYILLTGDYPAHDVWRQDREHNLASARAIVEAIIQHFPFTKVYPAIGNHEIFPVNMFPAEDGPVPQTYNPSWLYNNLADLYKHWLPDTNQQQTLRDSGYYSIMANKKLRIVSINANFCNNFNFWLLLNFNDPHNHLHWLYRQLHKAEINGERVFILGHIAPGTYSCLGRWSHEYNRLIKRFRNTVVGQFFGHTHHDEFQIFFKDNQAINIAFLAPSETSVDGLNPAYRVYEIDDETNLLVDHHTYYLDLKAANHKGTANLTLEYNCKSDLQMKDMSPESWHDYVKRLARNSTAFDLFRQHFYHHGPAFDLPCDDKCKEALLCSLLTSEAQLARQPKVCNELRTRNEESWWSYFWSN